MYKLTKYDKKMLEFNKRYDKFKKNNLPTPFFDEERQTFEYVLFDNERLIATPYLSYAFENIIWTGFYYSFNCRHYQYYYDENKKATCKEVIGHVHEHNFENVIKWVYESPETFNINKEDEQFYSNQELKFLRRLQKFLKLIGLKDREPDKNTINRYRNKLLKKYRNAFFIKLEQDKLKHILNDEIDYLAYEYNDLMVENDTKRRALILDETDSFIMFIEFIKKEVKEYKNIKKYYKINVDEKDKVIIDYFKIIERF